MTSVPADNESAAATPAKSTIALTGDGAMKTWDKATKGTGGASKNTNCNFNGD